MNCTDRTLTLQLTIKPQFLIMIFSLSDLESEKIKGCKVWKDILPDMEEKIKDALVFIRTGEGSRKLVRPGGHYHLSAVST